MADTLKEKELEFKKAYDRMLRYKEFYVYAKAELDDKEKKLEKEAAKEREVAIKKIEQNAELTEKQRKKEISEIKTDCEIRLAILRKRLAENKAAFNDEKKFTEEAYDDLIKLNKKKLAEELLLNKTAEGEAKQNDKDIIERYQDTHKAIVASKKGFLESIKKLNEKVNEEEINEKRVKEFKDKWGKIHKDLKEYTDIANGALKEMFSATTSFLDQEKAILTKELGEINKQITTATKELELAKKRSAEELASSKKKYIDDNNLDGNKEKQAELEELERLHNLQAEMEEANLNRNQEAGDEEQRLTDNQLEQLNKLRNAHGDYAQSLESKTDADKQAQSALDKLNKEKAKKEEEIKKKDKQKRKIEITQQMAQAAINIALGITKALSFGPLVAPFLIPLVAVPGAIQLALMAAQMARVEKMEDGGLLHGKRHSRGGMRIEGSNIEVEGGEYVVNRDSTDKNLALIRYINSQRRPLAPSDINSFFAKSAQGFEPPFRQAFAQGGQLPPVDSNVNVDNELLLDAIQSIKIEPKVSVTDINSAQADVVKVDAWTGM